MTIRVEVGTWCNQWIRSVMEDIELHSVQRARIEEMYRNFSLTRKQKLELIGEVEDARDSVIVALHGLATDCKTRSLGYVYQRLQVEKGMVI